MARRLPSLLLAGLIALAASGCNSRPDASPASPGARHAIRIVALGDSTTEAGWEGNAKAVYAERLARALEANGVDVEMINAGLGDTLRSDGAKIILMTPNPMRWSALHGDELRGPALGFDFDDPRGVNRLLEVILADLAADRSEAAS